MYEKTGKIRKIRADILDDGEYVGTLENIVIDNFLDIAMQLRNNEFVVFDGQTPLLSIPPSFSIDGSRSVNISIQTQDTLEAYTQLATRAYSLRDAIAKCLAWRGDAEL